MRTILTALAFATATTATAESTCRPVPRGTTINAGRGVTISVRTIGTGRPLVMLPSFARGSSDFDELAGRLASHGFMTILPEPRGINGSTGPAPADLFDLAEDIAAVTKQLCHGKIDLLGHAYGNRIARAFATTHPEAIDRVALLAGGGEVPPTPQISAALAGSVAMGMKPDPARLTDLQLAFFAKGSDPSRWLTGWYPGVAPQQSKTVRNTPAQRWWKAGGAPIMLVQAQEDALAPAANAAALQRDIGDRLTLVTLAHAGHAILPEQPEAVATALTGYFVHHASAATLQRAIDAATHGEERKPQ